MCNRFLSSVSFVLFFFSGFAIINIIIIIIIIFVIFFILCLFVLFCFLCFFFPFSAPCIVWFSYTPYACIFTVLLPEVLFLDRSILLLS